MTVDRFEVGISLGETGERFVFIRDPSGRDVLIAPSRAGDVARGLRASRHPVMCEIADGVEAVAHEIETTAGSA